MKDAASAAIYGTRGAGGVILVTTKSGKEGEMRISVDANYGIQKITSGLDLVNASESIYLACLFAAKGEQIAPNYVWNSLWQNTNLFANDSNVLPVVECDNQPMSNVSLTLSGGKNNITYSLIGNFFKQDGILLNSGYERYNIRANSLLRKAVGLFILI